MKLLADRLVRQRPIGRGEVAAIEALKRPAINHTAGVVDGIVDRFVFDHSASTILRSNESDTRELLLGLGRIPTPSEVCWIEIAGSGAWLINRRRVYGFADISGSGIRYMGEASLDDWPGHLRVTASTFATRMAEAGLTDLPLWGEWLFTVAHALVALACPRTTSTRLVRPNRQGDRAHKEFLLRRAQRGLPVFSYNKVDLIRPQTAMHNGVLRSVESFAGTRMHMVIGHWRLIDGVIEPYWIWVDGHKRGNPDLGTIVKERHVRLSPAGFRRGFPVPTDVGRPSERRPAR